MRKRLPLTRRSTKKQKSVVQKYFEHALRADVSFGLLKPGKNLLEYRKEHGKILIKEDDVKQVKEYLTPDFFNSKIKIKNFISYEQRTTH